eukprot:GFKZ01003178.1.p3 GENE.GFKZ01003178.1~~GFKZ01003178.1.p3  ORF type:complete len:107 (+),score=4.00 GFKZ01003178.1:23-343(+)
MEFNAGDGGATIIYISTAAHHCAKSMLPSHPHRIQAVTVPQSAVYPPSPSTAGTYAQPPQCHKCAHPFPAPQCGAVKGGRATDVCSACKRCMYMLWTGMGRGVDAT